jgi:hypothetical protein
MGTSWGRESIRADTAVLVYAAGKQRPARRCRAGLALVPVGPYLPPAATAAYPGSCATARATYEQIIDRREDRQEEPSTRAPSSRDQTEICQATGQQSFPGGLNEASQRLRLILQHQGKRLRFGGVSISCSA